MVSARAAALLPSATGFDSVGAIAGGDGGTRQAEREG